MLKYVNLFLLFSCVLFIECEKRIIDYRNKFCGTWQFEYHIKQVSLGNPTIESEGTYQGKVFYHKKDRKEDGKKFIYFEFAPGWTAAYLVDKSGQLTGCVKTSKGEFTGTSAITFTNTSVSCMTRLGGEDTYTVSATR
jgi:hypothetical protein